MKGLLEDAGVDAETVLGTIQEKYGSYDEQRLADAVERTVSADGTTADNIMDRIIADIERTTAQAMDRVFLGQGGRGRQGKQQHDQQQKTLS